MSRFLISTAAACITVVLFGAAARANAYLEVGDAGDINNPQATIGSGGLSDIFGSIGGADTADAFAFLHTAPGGFFFIGSTLSDGQHPTITLFDGAKNMVASDVDNIDLSPIPVGTYYVQISINDSATQYHLFYDGEAQFLQASVPEPASLALLGLGLGGLAMARRRRG